MHDMNQRLRVVAFDGGWNLPIWAAQAEGYFQREGVSLELVYTPNSMELMTGLYEDRYDIALAGADNIVAYQEGQVQTQPPSSPDAFMFMGGDGGFLTVVADSSIHGMENLRGKTLAVDAMTTGFAFVLRELLARSGIEEADVNIEHAGGTGSRYEALIAGRFDATLLRTPFEFMAADRGFHVLARAQALGPYQGTVGAARRKWAEQNSKALTGFIRAYHSGLDWARASANQSAVLQLLMSNMKGLTPQSAVLCREILLDDTTGLTPDLSINREGMETLLSLRSKYGQPQKTLGDPDRYVDYRYLNQALGKLNR